jgi:hypothetical protein
VGGNFYTLTALWIIIDASLFNMNRFQQPIRVLAEDLVLVDWGPTTAVLDLTAAQRRKALDRGSDAAKKLYRKNLIQGCLLVVKSDSSLLDPEGIIEYPTETWA